MGRYLITGCSTVGKSTVAAELIRRGLTAIDGDDEGIMTDRLAKYPILLHLRVTEHER